MASSTTLETVTSADGTRIAFERTGSGSPLVLVHGTAGDHTRWELFDVRPALADHCTVYAIDRRGRGGSGDAPGYDLEREYEDVAAVVDAIGEPVALLGHSYGAICALGASLLTENVRRLVLYEPPIPWEIVGPHLFDEEAISEMEALLSTGEDEQALVLYLRDVIQLSEVQLDDLRAAPSWQPRVDAAHTLPREERAPAGSAFDTERFGAVSTPTLLLLGGESPGWAKDATEALNEALPNSRVVVLEGQGHLAMNTAPDLFVDVVLNFVLASEGGGRQS